MYQYAYLLGVLVLGVIWLTIFLKRKDLRHEQLFMSFLTAPLAPITQILWFYHDYWRPEYFYKFYINNIPIGIEEVLFGFFVGGIGSVLYEFIRDRKHRLGKKKHLIAIIGASVAVIIFLGLKYSGLNTIWSSTGGLILSAVILVILNRKLEFDFIWSGMAMLFIAIVSYAGLMALYPDLIARSWVSDGLSGNQLLNIPIEELAWFLAWGAFSGIIYESWINVKAYPTLAKVENKRRASPA